MKKFNIKDDEWCLTVQDRRVWNMECKEDLKECTQEWLENDRRRGATAVASLRQSEHDVVSNCLECGTCHCSFRRKLDTERHKCQRSRNVHQDQREVEQQAPNHHPGDMLYLCKILPRKTRFIATQVQATINHSPATTQLTCSSCGRSFLQTQDILRHKCRLTRERENVTEWHHLFRVARFQSSRCVCVCMCVCS